MPAGFVATDFSYLLPELVLTGVALVVLLADAFAGRSRREVLGWLTILGLLATTLCVVLVADVHATAGRGLVAMDGFATFFKIVFLFAAAITVLMSMRFLDAAGLDAST